MMRQDFNEKKTKMESHRDHGDDDDQILFMGLNQYRRPMDDSVRSKPNT